MLLSLSFPPSLPHCFPLSLFLLLLPFLPALLPFLSPAFLPSFTFQHAEVWLASGVFWWWHIPSLPLDLHRQLVITLFWYRAQSLSRYSHPLSFRGGTVLSQLSLPWPCVVAIEPPLSVPPWEFPDLVYVNHCFYQSQTCRDASSPCF